MQSSPFMVDSTPRTVARSRHLREGAEPRCPRAAQRRARAKTGRSLADVDDVSAVSAEVVVEVRQVRADRAEGLAGGAGGHLGGRIDSPRGLRESVAVNPPLARVWKGLPRMLRYKRLDRSGPRRPPREGRDPQRRREPGRGATSSPPFAWQNSARAPFPCSRQSRAGPSGRAAHRRAP